ncbi:MAG: hypothetical protein K8W52_41280 [Deltaproteobacteria bacterium]|nr:hypothetical protein [Deltaproteobacteria bacterium]
MARVHRAAAVVAVAAAWVSWPRSPAHAYGFSIHSRILTQAYELRGFRLSGPDVWLARRRYTQTLSLDLVDLGDLARKRAIRHTGRGATISFSSYLRLDHDFGDWTGGSVTVDGASTRAIDAVPELRASSYGLDLLYAYVDARGLADGRVDIKLGRQLAVDALDWWAMDGATVRVTTPLHAIVEGFGGLRVRDASPLATSQVELDGTTGADCQEYVEGATPGTGAWQLIDRTRALTDHPDADDTGYCPQRDQWMPTFGGAIETAGFHSVFARLVYRRSESQTVGLLGAPDRLSPTALDTGYYPNEYGQAPAWGVNEERIAATVRANIDLRGGTAQVSPWAAARYSLLHGLIDEAEAGARLRWHAHAIEPEVSYRFPTFDGDSIFNVFSVEPSTEARLSWTYAPRAGAARVNASAWYRRYYRDDEGRQTAAPATDDAAGGGTVSLDAEVDERWRARGELFADGGYGGRRTGGAAALRWRRDRAVSAQGRATLLDIVTDSSTPIRAVTGALQLGATWRLADGVALSGVIESSSDRYTHFQARGLAILDLAFAPER